MIKRILFAVVSLVLLSNMVSAQRADLTVSLNEAFFDTLLDSVLQNNDGPELPIGDRTDSCSESIKLKREMGVRTSVRFREGKVLVPLAFSGEHAMPFIGCVDFAGWADTVIDLEFDRAGQRLVGRARVQRVNLNGTGGIGGSLIANLLQGSIDRRLNPFEILTLEKLSFAIPIQNNRGLRAQAVAVKPEVGAGTLTVAVSYEFNRQ